MSEKFPLTGDGIEVIDLGLCTRLPIDEEVAGVVVPFQHVIAFEHSLQTAGGCGIHGLNPIMPLSVGGHTILAIR